MGLQPSEQCTHCWSGRLAPSAGGGTRHRVRPSAVTTAAFWLTTQEGQSVHSQAADFIITHVLQFKLGEHKGDTGRPLLLEDQQQPGRGTIPARRY